MGLPEQHHEQQEYLIWSHEHRQWWAPNLEGYVSEVSQAGRYSWHEVAKLTVNHVPHGEEVAVPAQSAQRYGTDYIWGVHPVTANQE